MSKTTLYTLYSCMDGEVKFVATSNSKQTLEKNLVSTAESWICDRVGSNNYVNTLESGEFIKNTSGYVLKYSLVTKEAETKKEMKKKAAKQLAKKTDSEDCSIDNETEVVEPEVDPLNKPTTGDNTKQINVFLNEKKKVKGWIYNGYHKDIQFVGYFAVCKLPLKQD